jgi:hypothetical protein
MGGWRRRFDDADHVHHRECFERRGNHHVDEHHHDGRVRRHHDGVDHDERIDLYGP